MQRTHVRAVAVIQPPPRAKACTLRNMGEVSRVKSGSRLHADAYCYRFSLARMQPPSRVVPEHSLETLSSEWDIHVSHRMLVDTLRCTSFDALIQYLNSSFRSACCRKRKPLNRGLSRPLQLVIIFLFHCILAIYRNSEIIQYVHQTSRGP